MSLSPYLHYATSASTIHVLSYGTLLGTTLFQTFIVGPVQFTTIPRQQFGNIQAKLTPIYFGIQVVTAAACYFTVSDTTGTYNELLALGVTALGSLINLLLVGPKTTSIMQRRHKMERLTNTKYDDVEVSDEMRKVNRQFNVMHSVGATINVVSVVALLAHGIHLGHKLNLIEPY